MAHRLNAPSSVSDDLNDLPKKPKKPKRTKAEDEKNGVKPDKKRSWGGSGRLSRAQYEELNRKERDAMRIAFGMGGERRSQHPGQLNYGLSKEGGNSGVSGKGKG
jgi:hypothetical protein